MNSLIYVAFGFAVGYVFATAAAAWADYSSRPSWHFRFSWLLRRRRERRGTALPKLRAGRLPK